LLGDREFVLEGGVLLRRPARGPRGLLTGCASAKSWWVQPFCRWSAAAMTA